MEPGDGLDRHVSPGPPDGEVQGYTDAGSARDGTGAPAPDHDDDPAGAPVDEMIGKLAPLLEPGDILIDGGNSYFEDTRRREAALRERRLHFVGCGVSGGEEGARHVPSIMPGGSYESWARIKDVFEA